MNSIKLRVIISVFLFFVSIQSQKIIHDNINIEDGLIYSMVLSIYEDNNGRLWFGTHSGLSCWDGVEFENYLLTSSLSSNNCKWLTGDNKGTLFIATRNDLTQYKNNIFSSAKKTWTHLIIVYIIVVKKNKTKKRSTMIWKNTVIYTTKARIKWLYIVM